MNPDQKENEIEEWIQKVPGKNKHLSWCLDRQANTGSLEELVINVLTISNVHLQEKEKSEVKSLIMQRLDTLVQGKAVELEEKDFSSGYVGISLEYKGDDKTDQYEWKHYEIVLFVDGLRCLTFQASQYSYLHDQRNRVFGYCLNGAFDIYRHGILHQRIHYSSAKPHGECFEYDVHGEVYRYAYYVQGQQRTTSISQNGRFMHKQYAGNVTNIFFSNSYNSQAAVDQVVQLQNGKVRVWGKMVNGQFVEKARVVDVRLEQSSRPKPVLVEKDNAGNVQYLGEYKVHEEDYSYTYEGRGMKFKSTGEVFMGDFREGKREGKGVVYKNGLKVSEVECVDGVGVNSRRFVDGLPVMNEVNSVNELSHFSPRNVDFLVGENGLGDIPNLDLSGDKFKMVQRMIFGRNSLSELSQFIVDGHANVEQIEFSEGCLGQCKLLIIKCM